MTFYMMVCVWLRLAGLRLDQEWDLIQLNLERGMTRRQILYIHALGEV